MDANEFIEFIRNEETETGKTQRWDVCNRRSHYRLGVIEWYGPWRQYAFYPTNGHSVFNHDCLRLIADKCKELTKSKARA